MRYREVYINDHLFKMVTTPNGKCYLKSKELTDFLGYNRTKNDVWNKFLSDAYIIKNNVLTISGEKYQDLVSIFGHNEVCCHRFWIPISKLNLFLHSKLGRLPPDSSELIEFCNIFCDENVNLALGADRAKLYEEKSLNILSQFFLGLDKGMDIIYQYKVDFGQYYYFVDMYLPEYKICIEIDEDYHKYQTEQDRKRQSEIEKKLGCKFVRIKV